MSDHIHEALRAAAAKGGRIPGGCESCNAYQTCEAVEEGIWSLTVHHDDWCPLYRAMNAGAN